MANKNKAASAAKEAASKQAAKNTEKKSAPKIDTASVVNVADAAKVASLGGGLDANHTVDMLTGMRIMFHDDPNAAQRYDISQENVDSINKLTAMGYVAIFATSSMKDNTPFAITMRAAQRDKILEVAGELGITIDQKMLPAPDTTTGLVEIPSSAIKVSKEAKDAIKEEIAAEKRITKNNPAEIETEQELKDAILKILVKGGVGAPFYNAVTTAINFYRSYLTIQASKSENKDAELARIKELANDVILADIAKLLGKCPFTTGGMAKQLFDLTDRAKSPVYAFCAFREASLNKKTGMPQIDDQLCADIVKVLINWYGQNRIESANANLEVLNKDKEKNKTAISGENAKIAHANEVIKYVMNPDVDFVKKFAEIYTDNKSEGFPAARMIGSNILKNYYPGVKVKEVTQESLVHNISQYVGVITNFFMPTLSKIQGYAEANIGELVKVEAPAEGDKKESGEESKKA